MCVAAAGVAVGAVALDSDDSPAPAAATSPASTTPPAEGYGAANDAGAGAAPARATLAIRDFQLAATSVAPGGRVTIENGDGTPHTVTADDGAFATGEVPGGSASTFRPRTSPGPTTSTARSTPA